MKMLFEGIGWILIGLEWGCWNREKSIILGHVLGILGIFRGGKGSQDGKTGNKFLLDIL
jgi:hypothetical protein